MAYATTAAAIGKVIDDGWDASIAKIFAENLPAKPPTNETWVRFSLRPATRDSIDVTAMTERGIGVLYFQIFTPEGQGTRKAEEVVEHIGSLFNESAFATSDGRAVLCRRVQGPIYAGLVDKVLQHNATVQYQDEGAALNAA